MQMLVPEEGVEPTRPCDQRILSPPRLPFRHSGSVSSKVTCIWLALKRGIRALGGERRESTARLLGEGFCVGEN